MRSSSALACVTFALVAFWATPAEAQQAAGGFALDRLYQSAP